MNPRCFNFQSQEHDTITCDQPLDKDKIQLNMKTTSEIIIQFSNQHLDKAEEIPIMEIELRRINSIEKGIPIPAIADTGCNYPVMGGKVAEAAGLKLHPISDTVRVADNRTLKCLGSVTFDAAFQGHVLRIQAYVIEEYSNKLFLSCNTLRRFGCLPLEFPNTPHNQEFTFKQDSNIQRDSINPKDEKIVRELRNKFNNSIQLKRIENTVIKENEDVDNWTARQWAK